MKSPRRLDELRALVDAANDWSAPQSFLHRLAYAREVDGVYTSFRDGTLTRYRPGGAESTELAPADAPGALADGSSAPTRTFMPKPPAC